MNPAAWLLREVPDAGGAGGGGNAAAATDDGQAAGAGDDSTTDDGVVDDAATRAQAAGADDDDLDTFDETEYADLQHDPRVKRLLQRTRKLSNRDRRATPFVQQLRTAGVEKPEQLLELIQHARSARNVEQLLQNNPRLRATLYGGEPAEDAGRGRQAADEPQDLPEDTPFEFDESPFAGFDRSDPGTNALLTHIKQGAHRTHVLQMALHRLFNANRSLSKDVGALKGTVQGDRSKSAGAQWKAAVDTAAGKLPSPKLGNAFRHAVFGAILAHRQRTGQEPKAQDVIESVLKDFVDDGKVTSRQAASVAAGQQRVAERNRTLPNRASMAGGAAATPVVDRSTDTIWDINKRKLGKRYVGSGR
jgi:hypothetical protein